MPHETSGPATPGAGLESDASFETAHWPTELRLKTAERRLEIDFDNGRSFSLPAELLRVESPSAEVQGHRVHRAPWWRAV